VSDLPKLANLLSVSQASISLRIGFANVWGRIYYFLILRQKDDVTGLILCAFRS